jgi:hypothetical protein
MLEIYMTVCVHVISKLLFRIYFENVSLLHSTSAN